MAKQTDYRKVVPLISQLRIGVPLTTRQVAAVLGLPRNRTMGNLLNVLSTATRMGWFTKERFGKTFLWVRVKDFNPKSLWDAHAYDTAGRLGYSRADGIRLRNYPTGDVATESSVPLAKPEVGSSQTHTGLLPKEWSGLTLKELEGRLTSALTTVQKLTGKEQ